MKNNIADEMEKILHNGTSKVGRVEELEKAEIPLNLMQSTVFLSTAAAGLQSLGKEGEAKFLWKIINAAQTKLKNEVNETSELKKEASVKEDSYQKYSNLLKG